VYQGNASVVFGKIDGPGHEELAKKYGISSYPSIVLFWRGIDLPIFFQKEREVESILEFLKYRTVPLGTIVSK